MFGITEEQLTKSRDKFTIESVAGRFHCEGIDLDRLLYEADLEAE